MTGRDPSAAPSFLVRSLERCAPWIAALYLFFSIGMRAAEEGAALQRLATLEGRAPLPAAFPLDDAYIYQVYGRNLARGEGYAFNAGRPDSAATSLLWALVVSTVYAQQAIDPLVATKVLGAALAYLACALLGVAVRRFTGSALGGAVAALALASTPRVAWSALAGMDPPLTMALVAAALCFAKGPRPRGAALALFGLAGFSRPEAFLLLPLAALAALLARCTRRRVATEPEPSTSLGRFELRCALFALGACTAYAAANLLLAGDALPSTFRAKVGPSSLLDVPNGRASLFDLLSRAIELPWKVIFFLWEDAGLLLAPACVGLLCLTPSRREPLRCFLPLLVIAYPLAKELLAPSFNDLLFQHGRQGALLSLAGAAGIGAFAARASRVTRPLAGFALALSPALVLLCALRAGYAEVVLAELRHQSPWIGAAIACGIAALCISLRFSSWRVHAGRIAALALLLFGGARAATSLGDHAREQAEDVRRIAEMHVGTGRWLAEHTPATAVIGANDIGAIGYYSQRRIVDLFGLLDARILRFRRHASGGAGASHAERSDLFAAFLSEPGLSCDNLALFPEWFPGLLRELAEAPLGAPSTEGGTLFTVVLQPNPTTGSTLKCVVALAPRR